MYSLTKIFLFKMVVSLLIPCIFNYKKSIASVVGPPRIRKLPVLFFSAMVTTLPHRVVRVSCRWVQMIANEPNLNSHRRATTWSQLKECTPRPKCCKLDPFPKINIKIQTTGHISTNLSVTVIIALSDSSNWFIHMPRGGFKNIVCFYSIRISCSCQFGKLKMSLGLCSIIREVTNRVLLWWYPLRRPFHMVQLHYTGTDSCCRNAFNWVPDSFYDSS